MRVISILQLVAIIVCCFPFSVSAGAVSPAPEWDTVLDGIHAYTWRGRAELAAELKKVETRVRQDLAGYIAAWEHRMAVPILYTGKASGQNDGEPPGYFASDFTDARKLIIRLREKKDPVAQFLFEKLTPEAQKAIAETDLAVLPSEKSTPETDANRSAEYSTSFMDGESAKVSQLLAGELTRIVREDTVYDPERFAGIQLSPAAMALVTGHNAPQNRVCINKTLLAEAFPKELARNFKCFIQKDETYRRVVAAKTVQYLRTGDKKTLDEGIALSETFANKLMYTDFAFWYYYPRALADIENKNSAALQSDAYGLLNDVVLWGEPPETGKQAPAYTERRHYVWNLADLVLTRGIIEGRMEGLEALGPAVWILGDHRETQAVGERERELSRLIVDVRKYLSGPESDNFRLNYAVAMLEGEKRQALLTQEVDAKRESASVAKLFDESREYLRLAYEWAGTGQGKAIAATKYLELINMGLARLKDTLPQAAYASLTGTKDAINASEAFTLYRRLAAKEKGGWKTLGFNSRISYINSAQRLWNALKRNSLLVGDYYLAKMDKDDFQSVMDNSEPAEKALLRYVDLFEMYTANGHRDIIPDSAYFAYAEALKKLSRLSGIVYSYNKNMQLQNQSVNYLLKAISIYPYDDSISEYAAMSRNINTGSYRMLPDAVLSTIVSNDVMAKCLRGDVNYCDKSTKQALEWSIYKVRNKLYGTDANNRLDEIRSLIINWKNEPYAPGTTKTQPENQRGAIFTLADRYMTVAGQLSVLTADSMERLKKCRTDGSGCEDTRDICDQLQSRRDESKKIKDELINACKTYAKMLRSTPGDVGNDKEMEYSLSLPKIAVDVYVGQTDRIFQLSIQKQLSELRQMDNCPMHKVIKAGYYAAK
jgi:hypothetical protein